MNPVILPVMGPGRRFIREPAGLRPLVPPLLKWFAWIDPSSQGSYDARLTL